MKEKLNKVLELYPQEQLYYAPVSRDISRKFYYSGDLNLFTFWCKYLYSLGTLDDKLFLEQSELKGYYPSYHYQKKHQQGSSQLTLLIIRKENLLSHMNLQESFGMRLMI